jgi:PKD repeat protein
VTFTSTSTDVETPTTLIHNWDFGDGTTSTEANPIHIYELEGMYNVTLEVVDPGSGTSTTTMMVTVAFPEESGCCDANTSGASYAALAFPVLLVLRRRRRKA